MKADARLGVARLALRGVIGSTMIAHGVKHARSLEGTAGWFNSIGFREAELQAKASAGVEMAAGAALLVGAATPLAASAVIGTMAVAARTVHIRNGFFITDEGYEYVSVLAAAATALAVIGPGRYSVDAVLGRSGRWSGSKAGLGALVIGIGSAAGHLAMYWREPARDRG
jgi:putative oxidoreductase